MKTKSKIIFGSMLLFYGALYFPVRNIWQRDYSEGGKMIFLNTSFVTDITLSIVYYPIFMLDEKITGIKFIVMEDCKCHHPLWAL